MSDAVPDSNPPTRWLWVALLVALGVAVVIIFFNPEGDADALEQPGELREHGDEGLAHVDRQRDEQAPGAHHQSQIR